MSSRGEGGGYSRALADDITSAASMQTTLDILIFSKTEGPKSGCIPSLTKQSYLLPEMQTTEEALEWKQKFVDQGIEPQNIKIHPNNYDFEAGTQTVSDFDDYYVEICGVPVGSREGKISFIDEKMNKLEEDVRQLYLIDSVKLKWNILLYVIPQRLSFMIRTITPDIVNGYVLPRYNIMLRNFLAHLCELQDGMQLSDLSFHIARVKGALGGFGLGFLEDQIYTSFVASITASMPEIFLAHPEIKEMVVSKINGDKYGGNKSHTMTQYFEAIQYLADKGVTLKEEETITLQGLVGLSKADYKGLQHELSKVLQLQRQQEVLDMMGNDHVKVAVFVSGQTQNAYCWMKVMAEKTEELMVENKTFSHMMRRRGAVPEPNIGEDSLCHCSKEVLFDRHSLHADMCHTLNGKGRVQVATELQNTTYSMCRQARLAVKLEKTLIKEDNEYQRNHSKHRMDLVISAGLGYAGGNNTTYIDTTTSNAAHSASKLTFANSRVPARVADDKERIKREKYKPVLEKVFEDQIIPNFIGVAVEVQGRYGKAAEDFYKKLVNLIAENSPNLSMKGVISTFWYQKLSITFQASVSRNILRAIEKHNKNCHSGGIVREELSKDINYYDNYIYKSYSISSNMQSAQSSQTSSENSLLIL